MADYAQIGFKAGIEIHQQLRFGTGVPPPNQIRDLVYGLPQIVDLFPRYLLGKGPIPGGVRAQVKNGERSIQDLARR